MAKKIEARFFQIRRGNARNFICSIRGNQAGSIYPEGKQFWASCANKFNTSDMFDTFAEAEYWLWQNWT